MDEGDKRDFCLALANAATSPMTTLKNRPQVIGSPIRPLLGVPGEVTFLHGMMSLLGGTSRQAALERDILLTAEQFAAFHPFRKPKITQTKWNYLNVATQYFANSGNVNTGRCVWWLQR